MWFSGVLMFCQQLSLTGSEAQRAIFPADKMLGHQKTRPLPLSSKAYHCLIDARHKNINQYTVLYVSTKLGDIVNY